MMPKDEVKLTDYGLAELYDERLAVKKQSEKEVGFMRGDSLPYMAPEVIKNIEITDRSDVWSVGCTVVEMVTGKVPWGEIGSTFEETFQTIAKQVHPPLPQKISKECRSFL
jgi:serine/threonine protein kinase